MNAEDAPQENETSLDLLEGEDRRILALVKELNGARGQDVEERADYGNHAKLLVRHFATREAALMDVVDGLRTAPALSGMQHRMQAGIVERRHRMDVVERMSRGVQGLYLNTGQDFDRALTSLVELVLPDVAWELDEGVPTIRQRLSGATLADAFHSAQYVIHHAPTHLSSSGVTWWERSPVVARLITVFHHLRDYPRATRDART